MIRWFRYVPHGRVSQYEAVGWAFSSELGMPHHAYAVLMEWRGDGEPLEP